MTAPTTRSVVLIVIAIVTSIVLLRSGQLY